MVRHPHKFVLLAFGIVLALTLLSADGAWAQRANTSAERSEQATFFFNRGREAEQKGDIVEAYKDYVRAGVILPKNWDFAVKASEMAFRAGRPDIQLQHARQLLLIATERLDESRIAKAYSHIGFAQTAAGNANEGLAALKQALELEEKINGPVHADVAKALGNLAQAQKVLGDFAATERSLVRAYEIAKEVFEKEDIAFDERLGDLAIFLSERQEVQRAIPLMEKYAANGENVLHEKDPTRAQRYARLGDLYFNASEGEKAVTHYARAIEIAEQTLGHEHILVQQLLTRTVFIIADTQQFARGVPFGEKLLALNEKIVGRDHETTIATMNNLSQFYAYAGDHASALPFAERAVEHAKKSLKPDDIEIATRLVNLGQVYDGLSRSREAVPLYERALEISKQKFGANDVSVARIANNLGFALENAGKPDAAKPHYEHALRVFREKLPAGHFLIRIVEGNLASVR